MLTYELFIETVEAMRKDKNYFFLIYPYQFLENGMICLNDGRNVSVIGMN